MKIILFLFSLWAFQLTSQSIITTVVGTGTAGFSGDGGQATLAEINRCNGIALDKLGNLYFCDILNNRVRMVNSSGVISTIAGTGTAGYSGDGGQGILANLNGPQGIEVDFNNNIYFTDFVNSCVRKINTAGIITTVAGNGMSGFSGDGGLATQAQLAAPIGVTFDTIGNIYIADYFNSRIRKVNTSGIITTIAGTGTAGYNGDSILATSAQLKNPIDLKFDKNGNLFITDYANHRIRKIDNSGIITTIAGKGTLGYTGDNGLAILAELRVPAGIITDSFGNLFFCDANNNVIRKIDSNGIITTIAGNGLAPGTCTGTYSGDNGNAILAGLNDPGDLALDSLGNLYIADGCNQRIRKVTNVSGINDITKINKIDIYPNPTSGKFTLETTSSKNTMLVFDIGGRLLLSQQFDKKVDVDVSYLNAGVYTLIIKESNNVSSKKLVLVR